MPATKWWLTGTVSWCTMGN